MKPIAIFRHASTEGPGYFATFLDEHAIPWRIFKVDAGDTLPDDVREFSGLVFMGGPMSVNDDLPWLAQSLELIRQAAKASIPLLGHCLGGQLIAKALGGNVARNPIKEIGWGEVSLAASPEASAWFGAEKKRDVFHWHGETFTLPPGAELLLSSAHCRNQAFLLDGKHLAMQCHIEMTEEMVKEWGAVGTEEIAAASSSPAVQTAEAMQVNLAQRVSSLNETARTVYQRWIKGLPA